MHQKWILKASRILVIGVVFTLRVKPGLASDLIPNWQSSLSPAAKAGQLIWVGLPGKELTPATQRKLDTLLPGGIVLFSRNTPNPDSTRRFINQINTWYTQKKLPLPFIAIDQEGGKVSRIKNGVTFFPAPYFASLGVSPQEVFRQGQVQGTELGAIGINFLLGPVSDVLHQQLKSFSPERAYGFDTHQVAEFSAEFIKGLQENLVAACPKHFPGHGNTSGDSHFSKVYLDSDLSTWEQTDLLPFKQAIQVETQALMTGHIYFKALDSQFPASLSKKIVTQLLREQLNFKGLIITDDLEMKSIEAEMPIEQASVQALNAGNDMVMIAWTHAKQKVSKQKIEEVWPLYQQDWEPKIKRILILKEWLGLLNQGYQDYLNSIAATHLKISQLNPLNRQLSELMHHKGVQEITAITPFNQPAKTILISTKCLFAISPEKLFNDVFPLHWCEELLDYWDEKETLNQNLVLVVQNGAELTAMNKIYKKIRTIHQDSPVTWVITDIATYLRFQKDHADLVLKDSLVFVPYLDKQTIIHVLKLFQSKYHFVSPKSSSTKGAIALR